MNVFVDNETPDVVYNEEHNIEIDDLANNIIDPNNKTAEEPVVSAQDPDRIEPDTERAVTNDAPKVKVEPVDKAKADNHLEAQRRGRATKAEGRAGPFESHSNWRCGKSNGKSSHPSVGKP